MSLEECRERLAQYAAQVNLLAAELDAYRLRVFGAIGGGIDASQFDLVIVCRRCGSPADPLAHACEAGADDPVYEGDQFPGPPACVGGQCGEE